MFKLFNDILKKAYNRVREYTGYNDMYILMNVTKYTKYNIPAEHDVPYIINLVYEDIFGFETNGVFVEIGAFDGETDSFTCFLADIGWTGHYVEPIKRYFTNCLQRHKKIKFYVTIFLLEILWENQRCSIMAHFPDKTS